MVEVRDLKRSRAGRQLPGISARLQEFALCILFHLLFPFLPLIAEVIVQHQVDRKTLLLFIALYSLGIGVSSRSRLMFGATVVISLVYSMCFGIVSGNGALPVQVHIVGYSCLIAVALFHTYERYNRHVADDELFWKFS